MNRLIRWLLALVLISGAVPLSPASAAAVPTLDGVQLGHLPRGLGDSTDFAYEYDDVRFAARVWESGSDAAGWRVDLDVEVLRGDRLHDAAALHDWFIGYQQRPPAQAHYRPVRVHGHRGWMGRDEMFWLVRPGRALAVHLDTTRWSPGELVRTAWGVRAP